MKRSSLALKMNRTKKVQTERSVFGASLYSERRNSEHLKTKQRQNPNFRPLGFQIGIRVINPNLGSVAFGIRTANGHLNSC